VALVGCELVDRQIAHGREVPLAERLWAHQVYDALVIFFETVGVLEELEPVFVRTLRSAAEKSRIEHIRRLAALVPAEKIDSFAECLHPMLALVAETPGAQAAIIERKVLAALDDPVELASFGVGLMWW